MKNDLTIGLAGLGLIGGSIVLPSKEGAAGIAL